ncbi:MAG: head GIN domain-containing protein [Janthinobacterium lividum]
MKNLLLPALLGLATLTPALAQSTQVRAVPVFHAINVGTGIELALTAGHSQRVEVSANTDEYRNRIETTVKDGVLTLRYKKPETGTQRNERLNTALRVAVTADELTALTAGSGSAVHTAGDFDAATFMLDISSGASVQADLATTTLTVRQSSGSTADVRGRATSLDIQSSSGSSFDASSLKTDRCRAQASSGSSITVAVKDDLVAEASSGGSISYKGSPKLTKRTSSGGGVSSN